MTTSTEALKDWISDAYDQQAKHLFVIKSYKALEPQPYFVNQDEEVELVRTLIEESGEEIVEEVNMEVKLLMLNSIR